jgi:AraC-like DNA-binding protein
MQKNKKSHNNALKEHISTYIYSNYTDANISLEQVAETLGYSSSYLSRFIKQEFGIGFGELLNKIRLDHAKKLLTSGIRPIGEISETVGYTSINSFVRAFKREEGITPSQYRNASVNQFKAENK